MKTICFSSFTFSYLNRARVLFESVKRYHPDWHCVALITDASPDGFVWAPDEPFDEIVYHTDLDIPSLDTWLFKHDIVEICTAVKGPYLARMCKSDFDVVVYLDPDTCLFQPLSSVLDALETHDIALTPHQLHPDQTRSAIIDNEVTSLKTGIYNLGFLAVRTKGEGRRMAEWWRDRLLQFCYDDIPSGLFVDQRWCDHVPSFFEAVAVLRDPGLNVASWNLSQRKLSIDFDGLIRVNDAPLRFWHFTKLGPVGDVMTKRYAGDNFPVYELWSWYRREVERHTTDTIPARYWALGRYQDGEAIGKAQRELFRSRQDLQDAFSDPYASGPGTLQAWFHDNA
jgi:hypothetical protein